MIDFWHEKLTPEDETNIEELRELSPDEAAVLHTQLRVAFDLLQKVSHSLKFISYKRQVHIARTPECTALACELDVAILAIAGITDKVGAEREP